MTQETNSSHEMKDAVSEESKDFEKDPENCDHPEEQIENVAHVGAGIRPRCSVCGFNFMVIGEHERVVAEGEYFESADFKCYDCERVGKSAGTLSCKPCI